MPNYTENYNLKKPLPNENYNIQDHNDNMDIIDEKLKEAMDKAEQAFTQANDGKKGIADVIGEPASSSDTFAQLKDKIQAIKSTMATNLSSKGVVAQATEALAALAAKIADIVRGSGNAKPEDVLVGKTFSNDEGPGQVGTMPNNGPSTAETITLTNQNQEYTIAKGYHSGLRKIKAAINGLVASVIKAGVNVGGIEGTFTSDATAVASDLLSGKTAYVNGNKLTGSMPNNGSKTFTPSKNTQTSPAGYYSGVTINPIPSNYYTSGDVLSLYQLPGIIEVRIDSMISFTGLLHDFTIDNNNCIVATSSDSSARLSKFTIPEGYFETSNIVYKTNPTATTISCVAALPNGNYVVGDTGGSLYLINPNTGQVIKSVSVTSISLDALVVDDSYIYVVTNGTYKLYKYDFNLNKIFQAQSVYMPVSLAHNGYLYGSYRYNRSGSINLYKVDANTGNIVNLRAISSGLYSINVYNDALYVTYGSRYLRVHSLSDLASISSYNLPDLAPRTPEAIYGVCQGVDGNFYVVARYSSDWRCLLILNSSLQLLKTYARGGGTFFMMKADKKKTYVFGRNAGSSYDYITACKIGYIIS